VLLHHLALGDDAWRVELCGNSRSRV